jgi:hypothetical protein
VTTLLEASRMALEALESDPISHAGLVSRKQAITALRQALVDADDTSQKRVDEKEKREQEPVAFCNGMPAYEGSLSKAQRLTQDLEAPLTINGVPLYPKTEWVGLTADEIWKCNTAPAGHHVECHICVAHQNVLDFAEAIEAKLKEKNT